MIQETVRIQAIDILHIDPLILDRLQFRVIELKSLLLDIVIVIENSIPIELHHVQVTLKFISNQETLDLLKFLFQKKSLSFFF